MRPVDESSRIADSSAYLSQDELVAIAANSLDMVFTKRDFLFSSGQWRGDSVLPPPRLSRNQKLLVGHSDYSLTVFDIVRLRRRGIRAKIFSSNLSVPFSLLSQLGAQPVPLGLTSPTNESELHPIYGDVSLLHKAINHVQISPRKRSLAIYANFDVRTARRHRRAVWQICEENPQIISQSPMKTSEGRLGYLEAMRHAGIVVCPRGNGLDTHRFYESLLVGAIPIVLKGSYSSAIANHFNFPKIELKTWGHLRHADVIVQQAQALFEKQVDYSPLTVEYWQNRLRE